MMSKRARNKVKKTGKEKDATYSDEEMLDISKDLYPLSHYVDDEDELVIQLFATIKQTKLQSMLPPLLKEIDLKELQNLCLHELRGMSRKRILAAINGIGQLMSSSSSSSSEFEDEPKITSSLPLKNSQKVNIKEENSAVNPDRLRTPPPPPMKLPPQNTDEPDIQSQTNNLTALDILELEMRAKLIKTMLEKQPSDEEGEPLQEVTTPNVPSALADEDNELLIPPNEIKLEPMSPELNIVKEISQPRSPASDGSAHRSSSIERTKSPKTKSRRSSRKHRSRSQSRSSSYTSTSRSRSRTPSSNSSFSDNRHSGSQSQKSSDNDKHKTRKLTRKEFAERMKKAKQNRHYRKRNSSESETDSDEDSDEGDNYSRSRRRRRKREKALRKRAAWEREYFEKLKKTSKKEEALPSKEPPAKEDLPGDVEEGEYSSKEEGELESGEEKNANEDGEEKEATVEEEEDEEGACTPSDEEQIPNKGNADKDPKDLPEDSPQHSKRHRKKKKRKASLRHSRSRSKTPPLLQKIRRTKKLPKKDSGQENIPPHITEPLVLEEFTNKVNISKESEWNPTRHTEPIDSDENIEDISNEPPEPSIPIFSKSISFSIGKKGAPSTKKIRESSEIVSENSNSTLTAASEETASEMVPKITEARPTLRSSWSALKVEDEIRHVVPCLEMPSNNVSNTEDLDLLFTDWEDLPRENSSPPDLTNDQSVGSISQVLEKTEESQNASETLNDSEMNPDVEMKEIEKNEADKREAIQPAPAQPTMDIIGVIEPRDDSNMEFDEESIESSSWSTRWLQSEKVQNVVSNSKILSKVRKKIQERGKDKAKEKSRESPEESAINSPTTMPEAAILEIRQPAPLVVPSVVQSSGPSNAPVIGSIEEYEKLIGLKVSGLNKGSGNNEEAARNEAIVLDSDDDDDSEEEALWSKIMKK